ncbi:hypothetical protein WJX74_002847 [Apatococcus lobatus]|uniref:HMG box domain-containing protein n=1 Tax=Apatococcus lobatus TaxID=904363 RepID=A0AAW1RA18_9CHLO
MAQEAAEQSLDERLNVLKELQQKNSLGKWAAQAGSAQGGLKPKWIGEPPKRPRAAAKIFSDEKLRLIKQSGSRPAWRANTIPRDVQDDFEGLPEVQKQAWETLAAEERAKYQRDLVSYDKQNPGYSASLGQKKLAASKPARATKPSARRKSAAVAGPKPIKEAVQFYIDEKVENRLRRDPQAAKQDPGELRKEIASKEKEAFRELAPIARERFEQQAADDKKRYLQELEQFPAAKAAWQKQQEKLQKQAAASGKTVAELAEGEAESDPDVSDSDDDDAKSDGDFAEPGAASDVDADAEHQPGRRKKASAAAVRGAKQGVARGRGRAVPSPVPPKAAVAQEDKPDAFDHPVDGEDDSEEEEEELEEDCSVNCHISRTGKAIVTGRNGKPIFKEVKAKARPVPRAQLACTAARKGPYGKAPAPGAKAGSGDSNIPRGMMELNGRLVPTAARKGPYGKAPVAKPKGPAAKPVGAETKKRAVPKVKPSAAASAGADVENTAPTAIEETAVAVKKADQPIVHRRGRASKAMPTASAEAPAATVAVAQENVGEGASRDVPNVEAAAAACAPELTAAAKAEGTGQPQGRKRGRPAKVTATTKATSSAGPPASDAPQDVNLRPGPVQVGLPAPISTETAKSADIDMLDVQPAVCGDAADGAQPISAAPAPSESAPVTSPGKPAGKGCGGKRKGDALVSEAAVEAAPKRRATGKAAAEAATIETTDAAMVDTLTANDDAITAGQDATNPAKQEKAVSEVPMRRGRGKPAASRAAANPGPHKPAAATEKMAEAAEAVNVNGAEAVAAEDEAALGKGARRGGKAKALAPKGGVAKPAAKRGRPARRASKAAQQAPVSGAEQGPEAASTGVEALAELEVVKGVAGPDFVPPTLEKQPGTREEPITSPVALMKAAGLPSGPAPVLPLNIALGSSQDASSQEQNIDAHLPTSQAWKTGKSGRRSSILGGLSNTVKRMWPFNRGIQAAAAATALPEGNEVAEEPAVLIDAAAAAAEGVRISPRLQQAAEQASQDGQRFVGRAVSKAFPDPATRKMRMFSGSVVSFDPVEALWRVEYEDDDREQLFWEELEPVLVGEPAPAMAVQAGAEQPAGQLDKGDILAATAMPQGKVIANGDVQSILEWLSSGGAAARAFRHRKAQEVDSSQPELRSNDRQLLLDVQKHLKAVLESLPGSDIEALAASEKAVRATLEGRAYECLKQEAELAGHAPPRSVTVPVLRKHLNVNNGFKHELVRKLLVSKRIMTDKDIEHLRAGLSAPDGSAGGRCSSKAPANRTGQHGIAAGGKGPNKAQKPSLPRVPGHQPGSSITEEGAPSHARGDQGRLPELFDAIDQMHRQDIGKAVPGALKSMQHATSQDLQNAQPHDPDKENAPAQAAADAGRGTQGGMVQSSRQALYKLNVLNTQGSSRWQQPATAARRTPSKPSGSQVERADKQNLAWQIPPEISLLPAMHATHVDERPTGRFTPTTACANATPAPPANAEAEAEEGHQAGAEQETGEPCHDPSDISSEEQRILPLAHPDFPEARLPVAVSSRQQAAAAMQQDTPESVVGALPASLSSTHQAYNKVHPFVEESLRHLETIRTIHQQGGCFDGQAANAGGPSCTPFNGNMCGPRAMLIALVHIKDCSHGAECQDEWCCGEPDKSILRHAIDCQDSYCNKAMCQEWKRAQASLRTCFPACPICPKAEQFLEQLEVAASSAAAEEQAEAAFQSATAKMKVTHCAAAADRTLLASLKAECRS